MGVCKLNLRMLLWEVINYNNRKFPETSKH